MALNELKFESGQSAFGQRRNKRNLQITNQVPVDGYAAGSGMPAAMGGMPGAAPADALGRFAGRDAMSVAAEDFPAPQRPVATTGPALPGIERHGGRLDGRHERPERRHQDVLPPQRSLGGLRTDRGTTQEPANRSNGTATSILP